jgi:hypothetical protein
MKKAKNKSQKKSVRRQSVAKWALARATQPIASKPIRKPRLLSGGNPQIAKADGNAPVQAYIAALSGWKHDAVRRVDVLVSRTVPKVSKAVKWNSPLYGMAGQGWFLSIHTFTKYIKVAFFRGTSLQPLPPGDSKSKEMRYVHICEDGQIDVVQFKAWVKQASKLPGWGKN